MKIFFLVVLVLHALIHLLGFAKGFNPDVKQLTLPISRAAGLWWLLACVAFLTTGAMYGLKHNYWWMIGFMAVLISQVLIILYWKDARFGTVANVIILLASVIGLATWTYYEKYNADVKEAFLKSSGIPTELLTESDIQELPAPVQRYIRYVGCLGKPKVKNFNIKFAGRIRKNEQSEWMPFSSEQHNFIDSSSRLFFMKATMKGLPVVGYHCYKNGSASMDIRLLSLVKVQYEDGVEMDKAETVTFFNDMCCMAPATLIDKRISWQVVNENVVKATFRNAGISISADLFFNDKGELINFKSNDRYEADAKKQLPWATPLEDYREVNGYKLAGYAEVIYSYPDGDLCYGTFELVSVQYNCTAFP